MKIKFPDSIRVGYATYSINVFKEGVGEAAGIMGSCDHYDREILIRLDYPNYEILNTLLHEINHAIFKVYRIDVDEDDEERVVLSFTNAWVQVYRDNPDLLRYMVNALKITKGK